MSYRDFSLCGAEALIRSLAIADQRRETGQQGPSRRPFTITISREAGALGNSVAAEVGRRLDWPVYDRNILDKIAESLRRPASYLEGVDERPTSWLGECLACLVDNYHISSDEYLKHLFSVVLGLGAEGRCLIVGRGANFILPAETTLRVRLVARPEDRARVVAKRLGLPTPDAALRVGKTDRERYSFVRAHFQQDAASPLHYDLVLNTSRLTAGEAADVIIETLRRLERRAASPSRGPADKGVEGAAVPAGLASA
jgi:cytidylate kinase